MDTPYQDIKVDARTPWREIAADTSDLALQVDAILYHCVLRDDRVFQGASNKMDVFLSAPDFALKHVHGYVHALGLALVDLDLVQGDEPRREQIKAAKAALGDKFAERVVLLIGAHAAALESLYGGLLSTPAVNGVQAFVGGTSSGDGLRAGIRSGSDAGDGKGAGFEIVGGIRLYSEPRAMQQYD